MSRKPIEIYLESRNAQVHARAARELRAAGIHVRDTREPATIFAVAAPDPRAVAFDLTRNVIHFAILKPSPEAIDACVLAATRYYHNLDAATPASSPEAAPATEAPVEGEVRL